MRNKIENELTNEEIEWINSKVHELTNSLIIYADKQNIDRDSFLTYFSALFKLMCEIATFKYYGENKWTIRTQFRTLLNLQSPLKRNMAVRYANTWSVANRTHSEYVTTLKGNKKMIEIVISAIIVYVIGYPIFKLVHSGKEIDNDK